MPPTLPSVLACGLTRPGSRATPLPARLFDYEAPHAGLCSDESISAQRSMHFLAGCSGDAIDLLESQDRRHLIARSKIAALNLGLEVFVDLSEA